MLAANAIQQGERSVVSPIKANYIVIWLMIVWNCQVVNRQAERRPNVSIICQESACGAIAYQLMKNIPSIKQKTSDRRLTWDIHSVGVVLSAETVRTRKACSRRPDSGDEGKKSKQKKSVGGRERGGRTLVSPSSFLPHFFFLRSTLRLYHYPLSEHLEQASAEKVLYPTKKRTQRAVEISEAV